MTGIITGKLSRIQQSIRDEGLRGYIRRLYNLGQYRRLIKLALHGFCIGNEQALVEGVSLHLPKRNAGIKEELILYGVHEPFATSTYKKLLRPGDVIIDVGTNIGYYLAVANSALSGKCMIHGFEADPELARLAMTNCKIQQSECHIQHTAIADKRGVSTFFTSDVSNWGTLLERDELRLSGQVKVPTTTIDNYCEEHCITPTVIRMDIEGGEILALRGARQVLNDARLIFLELHCAFLDDKELMEILDILESSGLGQALWFDRYYDWPWSHPKAAKDTLVQGGIQELREDVRSGKYKVMTVFAMRN